MNPYAAKLYSLAPVWGQNLLLSSFAARLQRERTGGRSSEYHALLQKTEWLSRTELGAYQDERLREVVTHAYQTVPYYQKRFAEYGVSPRDIAGRADLHKLPLLTRDDIRSNYDALWSTQIPPGQRRSGHTSGTTGTPLTVGYDLPTVWMTYAVFDRHYRWAGLRFGRNPDRAAVLRGNVIVPLGQKRPPFWRHNRAQNQLILSSFHLSKDNLPAYFAAMADFRPAVLDGYPSTLFLLAKYLESRGETFPLKAAVTSSETLYGFQREVIERQFECRVFDYYALAERNLFSGECEKHGGHHLAMEYGCAEVVDADGAATGSGTEGRLVGTTLHNMAMPLIRYVTNDIGALLSEACTCGRGLELMADVTTKAEDTLTLSDGRMISPSVLTHPFKPLTCIEGSQIVQTAPDAVTIRIIPSATYTQAHTEHLRSEFKARLGDSITIDVQMVDKLEVKPNGKFKWVISHVPLGI